MEKYYVPLNIYPELIDDFAVQWVNSNYRVFSVCPTNTPDSIPYTEISPWGHVVGIGTSSISLNTENLILGVDCSAPDTDLPRVSSSRSLFDSPNMTPFEPLYFALLFALSVSLFVFAFRLIFGKTYR